MGLFDKKKGDEFGSPVEHIDLSTPPSKNSQGSIRVGSAPVSAAPAVRGIMPLEPEPAPRYGISQAIELMRRLPAENVELVVQVVKRTLESTHIRIDTIIQDASRKQAEVEGRIAVLKQEIAELEREIATRKSEIGGLEADHRETTQVKERLLLAEKLSSEKSAASPSPQPGPQQNSAQSPMPIGRIFNSGPVTLKK